MPYDDPDPQDPSLLVGVELPASIEQIREMAWQFADELARSGHAKTAIVEVFADPYYRGAHLAFATLGVEEIHAIAAESAAVWGAIRVRLTDAAAATPGGWRRLPVLSAS